MSNKEIFIALKKCAESEAEMYFSRAEQFLLSETNRSKLNAGLLGAQLELAIILYNREGIEGEGSRSEGGISISMVDIPIGIQRTILQQRLARVSGHAFEKKSTTETTVEEKNN